MNELLLNKVLELEQQSEQIKTKLMDEAIFSDAALLKNYTRELNLMEKAIKFKNVILQAEKELEALSELLNDEEWMEEAEIEQEKLQTLMQKNADALKIALIPRDPMDDTRSVFIEIRAAAGGDESAIFAGDLFRLYVHYAEQRGWQSEVLNEQQGTHGGFKEIVFRLTGESVYYFLKFESGAHRVQRVPETETQGRIHTSTCTVAVLPEIEDETILDIKRDEIRIDTFRASGAGGQHVNKTDSAIRITHLPTGIVVECQEDRSQHKNKAKALKLIHSKLLDIRNQEKEANLSEKRKTLVGTGDRSERIRTYNFPQGRLTDHRIGLTLYALSQIMGGALDQVINPLIEANQAVLLENT